MNVKYKNNPGFPRIFSLICLRVLKCEFILAKILSEFMIKVDYEQNF